MTRKAVDIKILATEAMMMVPYGRVLMSEDGAITYEGLSAKFIAELNKGIIGDPANGLVYPSDGARFMNALYLEYKGTAVRASQVREEK